ncbi:unnamed protein product [Sphagnum troendelagicum]|uniref:Secreted protein n=1 Tax=Sphagnum troendelagicum TaxID=128251 RepID=A0ABP0TJ37_9BRYO
MNCIHFTLTTSLLVVASVPVCPSNNAKESAVRNTSLLLRSRRQFGIERDDGGVSCSNLQGGRNDTLR